MSLVLGVHDPAGVVLLACDDRWWSPETATSAAIGQAGTLTTHMAVPVRYFHQRGAGNVHRRTAGPPDPESPRPGGLITPRVT
jgi:hypothetical protein